jgi:hypothetical protein
MGKPPYKAKSPFTSMTVHKKGMSFHSPYGKDLITINESALSPKEGSKRKVLHQRQIKQNIRRAKDPKLGEVARNVTEPGQPLWQPEPSQIKRMKLLRIRQGKPYLMLHRDLLNTDRDREALVRGKVPFGQYNFHKFVRLPKPPGGKDWAQIGREQGRPEESLHPEGFRMPITDKGEMEWLRNYRLSREKIRREQEEEHMVDE